MGLKAFIEELKKKRIANQHAREQELARELFQICEHDKCLWITYSGERVMPCSMLKDAPIDALYQMREMYLKELNDDAKKSHS